MSIVKIPLSSLEVQLTGKRTTTPATIEFTRSTMTVRFEGLPRLFEVTFCLPDDGDLMMFIRDYHGTPKDKPESRIIHSWATESDVEITAENRHYPK